MARSANRPLVQLSRLASFRYLLLPASKVKGRFVIFSQSRSGTTLLRRFLNSHRDIFCDGELLSERVPWPRLYVESNCRRYASKVSGCKVFIHHLLRDQQIQDPGRFLSQLSRGGHKVIYLKRENILRHSVSQWLRSVTGVTHSRNKVDVSRHRIDVNFVVRHLATRNYYWKEAERAIENIPCHRITYEDDLENSERHQATMDKVFTFLDVEPAPVHAQMKRINDKKLSDIVENYDELARALSGTPYAHWLEEQPAASPS